MSKTFGTNPKPKRATKVKREVPEETLDTAAPAAVSSTSTTIQDAGMPPAATKEKKNMDVTLTLNKEPRKSKRIVIFNGPLNSVQFLRTAFPGDKNTLEGVPETITVSGEFAEPKAKAEKIVETKEQRKARLAALPKLTLAEKVARAEKRAEELKAKLAKTQAPAAEAPVA
jgi:hypothetical protein